MPEYWHYAYYVYYVQQFCMVVDFCCCCVLEYQLQIEWQWREPCERLEKFFKFSLNELKEQGHCDRGETKEDNRTSALQHVVLYHLFHGLSKITQVSDGSYKLHN